MSMVVKSLRGFARIETQHQHKLIEKKSDERQRTPEPLVRGLLRIVSSMH